VIGRLYVVLESDRGLVLMDQHAAHERILFEQMLNRLESGSAPSQRLLLPETVELSIRDAHFVRDLLPTLNRLGVGLSEFGERTFLLDALPHNPHGLVIHQELWQVLSSLGLDPGLVRRYVELTRNAVFYLDPHVCVRCRYRSTELLWQCPQCHEWNTFVEERIAPAKDTIVAEMTES
jgi:DNA mismatch repair protein MutL